MELSRTDRIGCSLRAIADSVDLLDDKFADSEGNIKITSLEDALEAASLLYVTFKQVYACSGKTFEITTEGVGGKVLKFLLDLLEEKTKG